MAMESMATLNLNSASLMQKYGSHGATDITGFGLLGHADNLAQAQKQSVDLLFHSLPVFAQMDQPVEGMPDFKVTGGYSAETSGGILTMLPAAKAKDFVKESEEVFGQKAWIVGDVVEGSRSAKIRADAQVIQVDSSFIRN